MRGRDRPMHVRFLAWEFPGVHSVRGTALARRIGQLAHGFAAMGWRVSVIHCQHVPQDPAGRGWQSEAGRAGGEIWRRAVPLAEPARRHALGALSRKLGTAWSALRYGDRTGRWVPTAWAAATDFAFGRPDVYVACFTPRGPLALAAAIHEHDQIPWIADLQDPWWEGSSLSLRPAVARWMRRTLRTAFRVVQVSPEWAREDADVLRRPVTSVRHAVPTRQCAPSRSRADREVFTLLYAGSITDRYQSLAPLAEALGRLARRDRTGKRVVLNVASNATAWESFRRAGEKHGSAHLMHWLGWLPQKELEQYTMQADCLTVIPFGDAGRRGVPSKLYELLSYERPILLAGRDSGGMASLLRELGHDNVVAESAAAIETAISDAISGDTHGLLETSRCIRAPLDERDLVASYATIVRAAAGHTTANH